MALRIDPAFRRTVRERLRDLDFNECYQCGKCSASCPVFHRNPRLLNPRRIIHMAALGIREVLTDPALWRCTTCYECVEECPQMVNFVDLVVALRNLAYEEGLAPQGVRDEVHAVLKQGFVYPITGRIQQIRQRLGLPELSQDLKDTLIALQGGAS